MSRTKTILTGLIVLGGLVFTTASQAKPVEFKLINGLRVSLRPIIGVPDATLLILFNVGEIHDPPGKSGLGHLVECVYLTAADLSIPQRSAEQIAQEYPKGCHSKIGDDFTVFAVTVPPARLADEIKQAAERMDNLDIVESDLERERPRIVKELNNMYDWNPPLAVQNHTREMLHPLPYGAQHGGNADHLKNISLDDVRRHWRDYYKANNAQLIITGNFDPRDVEIKVRQFFNNLNTGLTVTKEPNEQPPSYGRRQLTLFNRSAQPMICLGYRGPAPNAGDYPAFLTLATVLQNEALKISNKPEDFSVNFSPLDDFDSVYIVSKTKAGETTENAVARLTKFVSDAVRINEVNNAALLAKQKQAAALGTSDISDVLLIDKSYETAFGIGRCKQLGIDGNRLGNALYRLQQRDLQECIRRYFAPDKSAVVTIEP